MPSESPHTSQVRIAAFVLSGLFAQDCAMAKDDQGHIAVGLSLPDYTIDVEQKNESEESKSPMVSYGPAMPTLMITDFSLRGISFGASFRIDDGQDSEGDTGSQKVKTSYSNYEFSYFWDRVELGKTEDDQ